MRRYSEAQNERFRTALREARQEQFEGSLSDLAVAIGRSQESLTRILQGGGASRLTVRRFAERVAKRDVFDIIGREFNDPEPPPKTGEVKRLYPNLDASVALRAGWTERVKSQLDQIRDLPEDEPVSWWLEYGDRLLEVEAALRSNAGVDAIRGRGPLVLRIETIMAKLSWGITELGRKSELGKNVVSRILRTGDATPAELIAIAGTVGVDHSWLARGEGPTPDLLQPGPSINT